MPNNRGTRGPSRSSGRGFASMSQEEVRAIASKGGHIAHMRGTAHEWDSREAAEAGRKGGRARSLSRAKMSSRDDTSGRAAESFQEEGTRTEWDEENTTTSRNFDTEDRQPAR